MSAKRARIAIADDHGLMRQGLAAILAADPRFEVVGQAADAAGAVGLVRDLAPDVLLLDVGLAGGSGVDVAGRVAGLGPECRVVMVTMHARLDLVAACFRAGAMGYVVKDSAATSLVAAIEAVLRGERYLDAAITPQVLLRLDEYAARKTGPRDPAYDGLTRREQQILRLLAEGRAVAAIAAELFISKKTVENHRANICGKLGLANLAELVRYAARLGIVDLDDDLS
ncbi:MAG: response regulator (CheY-like receiver domain and HTH DNA-binding domain containing protein) [Solidesulfovibrio magneticus str. Maddingley MBC34]|uniref:Response regulator (CheY-like receiver domain and HTH DNA-binding domain containing protein) n=1 Tax=Solidesulfovibrio magneticus str. Maddingley MBC34 TaxID=1206767 RepID=K6FPM3_9BACT|nr:MAG: response regulator (CheY-like receiver domain and HTH DNA-binding domain containing protein) [Solidesulfovibrio magneticus str. Maddingley MBC34]